MFRCHGDIHVLLHDAVIRCQHLLIERYLVQGADVNAKDACRFGHTPLHKAATKGCTGCVRILLHYGSEVNTGDVLGQSPLVLAIYNRHWSVARILIQHGCRIELNKILCQDLPDSEEEFLLCHGAIPADPLMLSGPASPSLTRVKQYLLSKGMEIEGEQLKKILKKIEKSNKSIRIIMIMLLVSNCKAVSSTLTSPCLAKHPKLVVELRQMRRNPTSLQDACRAKIVRATWPPGKQGINRLNLPTTIKHFLCFSDFPDKE